MEFCYRFAFLLSSLRSRERNELLLDNNKHHFVEEPSDVAFDGIETFNDSYFEVFFDNITASVKWVIELL